MPPQRNSRPQSFHIGHVVIKLSRAKHNHISSSQIELPESVLPLDSFTIRETTRKRRRRIIVRQAVDDELSATFRGLEDCKKAEADRCVKLLFRAGVHRKVEMEVIIVDDDALAFR